MLRRAPLTLPILLLAALAFAAACGPGGATQSPAGTVAGETGQPGTSPAAPSPGTESPVAGSPATGDVEIAGVEYAYEGVPATAATGTTFSFRNDGSEVHEMVIIRKNEGVTQSWEELLQLPDEEALQQVTVVGAAFAAPGEAAADSVTVDTVGDHLMICFVPVGTTTMSFDPNNPPAGAPHFTEGMLAEFVVE